MSYSVSDFIIDRMIEWGVHRVYGFPGDGIGSFDGALGRADRDDKALSYIRPTHEEMAALMACAHAKFTGEVGVCVSTSGPGALHMVNGLYDAMMDNQPVVAIVGQQARVALGSDFQQENNLERVFADVAAYVKTVSTPMQAQMVVDRAFRIARTELRPCVIILPNDVQSLEFEKPARAHFVSRTGVGHSSTEIVAPHDEIKRAARLLNEGEKIAMMVGQGAIGATDEVLEVADKLGAGLITALLGKQVVPGDVPHHTQQLGLLGSLPSYKMMNGCDTLLMVGTNFPYAEFMPADGQARGVQIDLKPRHLALRYPMEVNLWGDARATLRELSKHLEYHEDRSWQEGIARQMRDWDRVLLAEADVAAEPINPRKVYVELNKRLPDRAIVTCDAGSTADWYGHHIRLRRGMMGNLSGRLATMIGAMPYAVAAKFAFPDRPVVCTIGDGAFQMLGMNEMLTVRRHWKSWSNPCFVVLVLHNNDLNQVSWEMRTEDGNPRWDVAQLLQDFDYAAYAQTMGFTGIKVTDPGDVGDAWDRALGADMPVLLDIHTDPNVPPLPGHIQFAQAKNVFKALVKGDPAEIEVIKDTAKAMLAGNWQKARNALGLDDTRDAPSSRETAGR